MNQKVSEYDREMPQSHTADQRTCGFSYLSHMCKTSNTERSMPFSKSLSTSQHCVCEHRTHLQLRHDLPISVKDKMVSPFHERFFRETSNLRSFAK